MSLGPSYRDLCLPALSHLEEQNRKPPTHFRGRAGLPGSRQAGNLPGTHRLTPSDLHFTPQLRPEHRKGKGSSRCKESFPLQHRAGSRESRVASGTGLGGAPTSVSVSVCVCVCVRGGEGRESVCVERGGEGEREMSGQAAPAQPPSAQLTVSPKSQLLPWEAVLLPPGAGCGRSKPSAERRAWPGHTQRVRGC